LSSVIDQNHTQADWAAQKPHHQNRLMRDIIMGGGLAENRPVEQPAAAARCARLNSRQTNATNLAEYGLLWKNLERIYGTPITLIKHG
jgi:hypothetical protein